MSTHYKGWMIYEDREWTWMWKSGEGRQGPYQSEAQAKDSIDERERFKAAALKTS